MTASFAIACGSTNRSTNANATGVDAGTLGACSSDDDCSPGFSCTSGTCKHDDQSSSAGDGGAQKTDASTPKADAGMKNDSGSSANDASSALPTHVPAACHVPAPTGLSDHYRGEGAAIPLWSGSYHWFISRDGVGSAPAIELSSYDTAGVFKYDTEILGDGLPVAAVTHDGVVALAYADINAPTLRLTTFQPAPGQMAPAGLTVSSSLADREVGLAWTGTSYGIVWPDAQINAQLRFARVVGGAVAGPSVDLGGGNTGGQRALAWSGTEFGAIWPSYVGATSFGRVSASGTMLLVNAQGSTQTANGMGIAWTGAEYAIAYTQGQQHPLMLARVAANGQSIGTPVTVTQLASFGSDARVSLVWNGSDLALAWTDIVAPSASPDVFVQRFDAALVAHGPAKRITNDQKRIAQYGARDVHLAWCGDEYVVTYVDQPYNTPNSFFQSVCD